MPETGTNMDHYTDPEDPFWKSSPESLSMGKAPMTDYNFTEEEEAYLERISQILPLLSSKLLKHISTMFITELARRDWATYTGRSTK